MGMMFTVVELGLLKQHLPDPDYQRLSKDIGVTLELVSRSKKILAQLQHGNTDFVSRIEFDMLVEEITEIQTKMFLIFSSLEKKGLISMGDLMAAANASQPEEKKHVEQARSTGAGKGRGRTTKPKSAKRKTRTAD